MTLLNKVTSEDSSKSSVEVSTLNIELAKATETSLKLQNEQIEHEVQVNNLKQKVSDLEIKTNNDDKYIRVLKLRSDRYFPYINFEGRHFDFEIPQHE
jgi:hypothetical protein